MSISPFPVRPGSPAHEARRARLVVVLVIVGIGASLLAYAISPGVRHAVGHAAHSVGHVFDRDRDHTAKKAVKHSIAPAQHKRPGTATTPAGTQQR